MDSSPLFIIYAWHASWIKVFSKNRVEEWYFHIRLSGDKWKTTFKTLDGINE